MKEKSLLWHLKNYCNSGYYPFHMPGHKRKVMEKGLELSNPFFIDITEIDGFDNLHHAQGILKESMNRAAKIYGSDETHYLVNGSSCGILSAICGCTSPKGRILIGRNCHKSAYHGIMLNQLKAEYIYPQIIEDLGIQGGILPEDVEKKLEKYPDIQAVFLVSPTYGGMVSDIERIAEVVHRYHIPLIVDEAHGAHFPYGREGEFPVSALQKGGDVVIQSLHKTLPSLTQTAIMHIKKEYLGEERLQKIQRYLTVFQSSSPSYVFMASMDNCIRYMEQKGRERLSWFYKELKDFYEIKKKLKHILLPGKEWVGQAGIYDKDDSKILMVTGYGKRNGIWLKEYMKSNYHLELEMCERTYALALTSLWDSQEGLRELEKGLLAADNEMEEEEKNPYSLMKDGRAFHEDIVYTIAETLEMPNKLEKLEHCDGKISWEFVSVYPPGIPYLVPGEQISSAMIEQLIQYQKLGLTLTGLIDCEQGLFLKIVEK